MFVCVLDCGDLEELDELELFSDETQLNNGGAAMTAYARMQFAEMSDIERQELKKALLQYCELDTLAMVMIYEGWRDLVGWVVNLRSQMSSVVPIYLVIQPRVIIAKKFSRGGS